MWMVAVMLAYSAGAGHGLRLAGELPGRSSPFEQEIDAMEMLETDRWLEVSTPLRIFSAFLLAFINPHAAWQVAAQSSHLPVNSLKRISGGAAMQFEGPTAVASSPIRRRFEYKISSESLVGRGRSRKSRSEFDFEQVIEILKADIPHILHRAPHWDLFSKDFRVIHRTGDKLEGLESNKRFLTLLRRMRSKFALNDEIDVDFISFDPGSHQMSYDDRSFDLPFDEFLVARWKVQLDKTKFPVDVELETALHVNDKNQVDYVYVDHWMSKGVFGHRFPLWPKVKLSDDRSTILKKVREWAKDIQAQRPPKLLEADASRQQPESTQSGSAKKDDAAASAPEAESKRSKVHMRFA